MAIAIGSDHAGFKLKEKIKKFLDAKQIKYEDFGTHSTDSVDYPDFAFEVAKSVSEKKHELGILVCGSGIGMSMVANKVTGIRAALCYTEDHAKMSRLHNDANLVTIGARFTNENDAIKIIDSFIHTDFSAEARHQRRIRKMHNLTGL